MKRFFLMLPLCFCLFAVQAQTEKYFNISKYSDIYNAVLRELELNYVDSLKHDQLTEIAISRMLYSLDPYTNYIPESKEEDVRRMRSGEYGGIGSMIMQRGDSIYISEPYEGMPAQRAGILPGDRIIEIDGVKLSNKSVAEASEMLRGTPGTEIVVKLARDGERKLIVKKFKREVIQVPTIPYFGVLSDSIGYVMISDFVDRTSGDFKTIMHDLVKDFGVKSLIIDLRDNGGGLVDQAVNILSLFLPRNSPVVTIKGRSLEEEKVYRTTNDPIYPTMPLVVMINGNTASSSEILAGALQDYDRAVIIGERSFGKGLIQNIRRLPYNSFLKVTVAKYYTPSGRCVQAIDYGQRQDNGRDRVVPDSLTSTFKTASGRTVRDGGGITPDEKLKSVDRVNIAYYLYSQHMFFDYANLFFKKHPTIAPMKEFTLSDAQYQEFVDYVLAKNFTYRLESEKYLQDLKEIVRVEGYDEVTDTLFKNLTDALQPNVKSDLERYRSDIQQLLEQEIIKRYYYQRGAIVVNLKGDRWLEKSIEILEHPQEYNEYLKADKVRE